MVFAGRPHAHSWWGVEGWGAGLIPPLQGASWKHGLAHLLRLWGLQMVGAPAGSLALSKLLSGTWVSLAPVQPFLPETHLTCALHPVPLGRVVVTCSLSCTWEQGDRRLLTKSRLCLELAGWPEVQGPPTMTLAGPCSSDAVLLFSALVA